jgi:hypothetical protein
MAENRATRSSSTDLGEATNYAGRKSMPSRGERRAVSQAIDPRLLKELAKKAQGLNPEEGMEVIIQEMKKIDPSILIPGI